jgi:hypothetical protein
LQSRSALCWLSLWPAALIGAVELDTNQGLAEGAFKALSAFLALGIRRDTSCHQGPSAQT